VPTTIVNRLGEEFPFQLKGNEIQPPQLSNEDDYFDWDKGISSLWSQSNEVSKYTGYGFKITKKSGVKIWKVVEGQKPPHVAKMFIDVNPKKLKSFLEKENFYELYARSQGGDALEFPPVKSELLKEENEN